MNCVLKFIFQRCAVRNYRKIKCSAKRKREKAGNLKKNELEGGWSLLNASFSSSSTNINNSSITNINSSSINISNSSITNIIVISSNFSSSSSRSNKNKLVVVSLVLLLVVAETVALILIVAVVL